jgi:photosystem II stability/assembly factor-like uncharacterized protein
MRRYGFVGALRTAARLVYTPALAGFLAANAWAQDAPAAANDAQATTQYSEIAPLASQSLLLDLVWAGPRIVVVGERGHILLSDDRGATWRQAKVPTLANLTGVFFIDARNGWAVGHDEVVLRTTDGGDSWTLTHSAPEKQQPLLSVWFKDANKGFAIGAYGTMLGTTDGGATWVAQTFDPQPLKPRPAAKDDEFSDEPSPSDMHLNAIVASATGKLYIAAEAGHIFRSDDEGVSWKVLTRPYEGSFFGILPLEGEALLAFGLRGHLFESGDAGATWREIPTQTVAMLTDGIHVEQTVVIAGLAGTLLVGRGSERAFALTQFPDRRGINAILALDAKTFVVAGEGGVRTVTP